MYFLSENTIQSISLFNEEPIVHKLSHQHLITSFWIVQLTTIKDSKIAIENIREYPVPILIHNFIEAFKF